MKKGFFSFHQGLTDIINCLPLINYYCNSYEELIILTRKCISSTVNFYIRDKPKVIPIYTDNGDLDSSSMSFVHTNNLDTLFHGFPDSRRKDKYANVFTKFYPHTDIHFVKLFYEPYDIPYDTYVDCFNFSRDYIEENKTYNSFVEKYGTSYVLYHSDVGDKSLQLNHINTNCINLNAQFDNIFYSIKILQHAKEIHLADSIWASFCYLLDAKFGLLKDVVVNLYPFSNRGGGRLDIHSYNKPNCKLEPINLPNWNIIFR